MVLYTKNAMYTNYELPSQSLRSESQMQTEVFEAYASTNDAFEDSGIDLTINVVHMQLVRIAQPVADTSRPFVDNAAC